jgi:uncharacterized membrane protein
MKKRYRYLIYGLSGWFLEILYTGLGSLFIHGDIKLRGQTYLWMFLIYGLAIFIEPIHNKFRMLPVIMRGVIYVFVIFSIEYATGYILKSIIGVCPWNYAGNKYSINGIIELDFAPIWFVAGLFFEKLHNLLLKISFTKTTSNYNVNFNITDYKYQIKRLNKSLNLINNTFNSYRKIK